MDIEAKLKEFEGFDQYIENVIKDHQVPGMAVAVVKDGEVILSKGYGKRNVSKNLGVDSETIFAIGSASKAFTTMAMGILVDKGEMDWDEPVRTYIPDFKLYDNVAAERMTPRDLVCHRSGLPRHDLLWYNSSLSRQDIFDRLQYVEPNKDFRSEWQYQNLMFMTAGYLVEAISGKTWEEFSKIEIFDRLGMTRSQFSVEISKQDANYSLPYGERDNQIVDIPFRNIDTIGPAGSINSCLSDMVKWVKLHLGGVVDGQQVISKAQLTEMHKPNMVMPANFMNLNEYKGIGDLSYGLGWFMNSYQGTKLIHHGGAIDGFTAFVSFMPSENIGAVILTNLNGNNAIFSSTFNIYDRLLGLDQPDWNKRWLEQTNKAKSAAQKAVEKSESKKVAGTKPSHDLSAYEGLYLHPGYNTLKIELKNGKLMGVYNNLEMNIDHYHYDIFEAVFVDMPGTQLPITFYTDYSGNICKLSIPLEPSVKDIEFVRVADESLKSEEYLSQFIGEYDLDGKTISVNLKNDGSLTVAGSGLPEMELEPYQTNEFKVKGQPLMLVEFIFKNDQLVSIDLSMGGAVHSAAKK